MSIATLEHFYIIRRIWML